MLHYCLAEFLVPREPSGNGHLLLHTYLLTVMDNHESCPETKCFSSEIRKSHTLQLQVYTDDLVWGFLLYFGDSFFPHSHFRILELRRCLTIQSSKQLRDVLFCFLRVNEIQHKPIDSFEEKDFRELYSEASISPSMFLFMLLTLPHQPHSQSATIPVL